ncbi:MAG: hypothetical protein WCF23_15470 [Candidatus Nitrosopolaris sp.]
MRWRYKLTDIGEEYLHLSSQQKSQYLCKLLLEFPIVNQVFLDISIDASKVIGRQHIVELLKKNSHLTGSTLGRRAHPVATSVVSSAKGGDSVILEITPSYYSTWTE